MNDARHDYRRFVSDHPGHPLGPGMPMGRTLRRDFLHEPTQSWRGESHRQAWERILRLDPCSFCGAALSGTVDHIEPRSQTARGLGGAHCWLNLTGACERCNSGKGARPLWLYLWMRAPGKKPDAAAVMRRVKHPDRKGS